MSPSAPTPARTGGGAAFGPAGGGAASGYTGGVTLYRVYHRRFEAYHHPDGRNGMMATWDRKLIAESRPLLFAG
jgi:hypothetical protein